MTGRYLDLALRAFSVAVTAVVVGATAFALVAAAATETPRAGGDAGIYSGNVLLDALAVPNCAAILSFALACAVVGALRARAGVRTGRRSFVMAATRRAPS